MADGKTRYLSTQERAMQGVIADGAAFGVLN